MPSKASNYAGARVDRGGFEPPTSAMRTQRSPTELPAQSEVLLTVLAERNDDGAGMASHGSAHRPDVPLPEGRRCLGGWSWLKATASRIRSWNEGPSISSSSAEGRSLDGRFPSIQR